MKISFRHLRNTRNIGDFACSPYDYFDWDDATVSDLRDPGEAYDIGIYGGGKIFGGLASQPGIDHAATAHIAWGVSTVQSFPISRKYTRARALCDLIGTREWGDSRYEFAPCASCMSPLFDRVIVPEHDVVFYNHAGKTDSQGITIPENMPRLSNNCGSLAEALAFIASGRTVVSNSYHGVYWAMLMGRRTICIPFSRKFSAYRFAPHYATPKNWCDRLGQGRDAPKMLEFCRAATMEFKTSVDEIIKIRSTV